ncbi:nitrate/nitrite transporter NarK [Glaciihabitans tibetensis]|uniref:Lysosomal dipeptide transporter MFSD1 n=2 Tax=Glaciihabitans tibetensis TaxID=1266600 RepID=A0A2T0VJC2_9MICO|nr:nitrate/nitrite transporter NarK [Glaciihabitans tibetensis]
MQRSSLGIAGVDSIERFDVSAAVLSTLAVVQLVVYAGLQIPVGLALDRVGPRFLITLGATLMVLGQASLALAPGIGVAIVGRVLVGAGDAMTFISILRLLSNWFSGRSLPLVSQLLGTIGTLGQVLSAIPLSALLHQAGWSTTYLVASGASLLGLLGVLAFVRNGIPPSTRSIDLPGHRVSIVAQLRSSLSRPGTRLGFWSHFVTQSSGTVFTLLWGFPFLSVGLGYGPAVASVLLTVIVASAMVTGPVLGMLSARFPSRRSNAVIGIVCALAVSWGLVLGWPGQPPFWCAVLLVVVIGAGGPGSLIGFDFARTFNPLRSLGSATGIVNVGGFLAAFSMMFLIGIVLDLLDSARGGTGNPAELYSLDSFRIAFLVQYLVVGTGMIFLFRSRRQTRKRMHEQEGIQVAPLWVALTRAIKHNTGR